MPLSDAQNRHVGQLLKRLDSNSAGINSMSVDLRDFYRRWSDRKEYDTQGHPLPIPLKLENAFLAGYDSYFNSDLRMTEGPFIKGTSEYYFWKYGWVRGFNEHLFPQRATR